jgi:hypothetical protein
MAEVLSNYINLGLSDNPVYMHGNVLGPVKTRG